MKAKARPTDYLYLAPAMLLLGLVTLYPLVHVFWLSLHRRLLIFDISRFAGFDNFAFLLEDDRFRTALWNTCYFTIVSVSLELILGLGAAVLVDRSFRGRGAMRTILLLPWVVPTVVTAKMWEWMYNADFGVLNTVLGTRYNWLGSPAIALNAAVLMDVWKTTPFVVLLLTAALQNVPRDLYRAAKVDGASAWTIFWRISLPAIRPVILVVLIFRTLDAFRVFDAVYVLTGGGPAGTTETVSIYAYQLLFRTMQFGYGSAVAVSIFAATSIITAFYLMLWSKE